MYVCWIAKVYLIALMKSFGFSLPFSCLNALYVILLLLRWSSIYWWEQRREVLMANRGKRILLHSPPGLDPMFYFIGLFLGLRPMYSFDLWSLYIPFDYITGFPVAPQCALCCKELGLNSKTTLLCYLVRRFC